MTAEKLETLFEKHDNEYLKFEKVVDKESNSKDLHAFLLLDQLVPCPDGRDIVAGADTLEQDKNCKRLPIVTAVEK